MNADDLILVSVDDHVGEPPGMFEGQEATNVGRGPAGRRVRHRTESLQRNAAWRLTPESLRRSGRAAQHHREAVERSDAGGEVQHHTGLQAVVRDAAVPLPERHSEFESSEVRP